MHLAKFCVSQEFVWARAQQHLPDRPLSLFEGDAGKLSFVSDTVTVAQAVYKSKTRGDGVTGWCEGGNTVECDQIVHRCCAFPGLDL